jgi:phage gp29-like protein
LARVSIDAPKNEDRTILSNLVAETVGLGAQVPIEPVMKRLNIPVAKEGDKDVFKAPAVAETPIPGGSTIATNVRGKLPPPSAKRLGEILAIEDDTEFAIALRSEFKTPEISK